MEKVEMSLIEREAYKAQKLAFEAQAKAFKAQAAYLETETEFPDNNNLQNDSEKVFILLMINFPFFSIFLTNRWITTIFNPLLAKKNVHQNWLI